MLRDKGLHSSWANLAELWDPLGLAQPLPFEERYFPLGFPLRLETNARDVVEAAQDLWSDYTPAFETEPIRLVVQVRAEPRGEGLIAPEQPLGTPSHHGREHLFTSILDPDNFLVWDLDRCFGFARLTSNVARKHLYTGHFFLEPALTCLAQRYATPIHASCVARGGRGILLVGQSGMGKSSLAWACTRAGLAFVSDDATWVLRDSDRPILFGKPHRMRFRPEALELFPGLASLRRIETVKGPRSFEIRTAEVPDLAKASTCEPWRILFLERRETGEVVLEPLGEADVKQRLSLSRNLFEPRVWREQEESLARLISCPAFVLRYSRLEEAVRVIVNLS
jgi:hypothetical protein